MSQILRNMALDSGIFPMPAWIYPGDHWDIRMGGRGVFSHRRSTWESGLLSPWGQFFDPVTSKMFIRGSNSEKQTINVYPTLSCDWYEVNGTIIPWLDRMDGGGDLALKIDFKKIGGSTWGGEVLPAETFFAAFDAFLNGRSIGGHAYNFIILKGYTANGNKSGPRRIATESLPPESIIKRRPDPRGPAWGMIDYECRLGRYFVTPPKIGSIPLHEDLVLSDEAIWAHAGNNPEEFTTDTPPGADLPQTNTPGTDYTVWQDAGDITRTDLEPPTTISNCAIIPNGTTRENGYYLIQLQRVAPIDASVLQGIVAALKEHRYFAEVEASLNARIVGQMSFKIKFNEAIAVSELNADYPHRDNPFILLGEGWFIRGALWIIGGLIGNAALEKISWITGAAAPDGHGGSTANSSGPSMNMVLIIGGAIVLLWMWKGNK